MAKIISTPYCILSDGVLNLFPLAQTEFSRLLKAWRGKLFQKEAADRLGVPLRTYQNWENGSRKPARTCMNCVREKMTASV